MEDGMLKHFIKAIKIISKEHPFFIPVLNKLRLKADPDVPTECINDELRYLYNPDYVKKVVYNPDDPKADIKVLCADVMHEVLHFVYKHHYREMINAMAQNWDHHLVNMAMDMEINQYIEYPLVDHILVENFKLDDGGDFPKKRTWEEYLRLLVSTNALERYMEERGWDKDPEDQQNQQQQQQNQDQQDGQQSQQQQQQGGGGQSDVASRIPNFSQNQNQNQTGDQNQNNDGRKNPLNRNQQQQQGSQGNQGQNQQNQQGGQQGQQGGQNQQSGGQQQQNQNQNGQNGPQGPMGGDQQGQQQQQQSGGSGGSGGQSQGGSNGGSNPSNNPSSNMQQGQGQGGQGSQQNGQGQQGQGQGQQQQGQGNQQGQSSNGQSGQQNGQGQNGQGSQNSQGGQDGQGHAGDGSGLGRNDMPDIDRKKRQQQGNSQGQQGQESQNQSGQNGQGQNGQNGQNQQQGQNGQGQGQGQGQNQGQQHQGQGQGQGQGNHQGQTPGQAGDGSGMGRSDMPGLNRGNQMQSSGGQQGQQGQGNPGQNQQSQTGNGGNGEGGKNQTGDNKPKEQNGQSHSSNNRGNMSGGHQRAIDAFRRHNFRHDVKIVSGKPDELKRFLETLADECQQSEAAHGCGNGSQFADEMKKVEPIRYDWKDVFKNILYTKTGELKFGFEFRTYQKPNRKLMGINGDIIYAANIDYEREINLVIGMDISGSMYGITEKMYGVIKSITDFNDIKCHVTILECDTAIERVIRDYKVDMSGAEDVGRGGGTDMGAINVYVEEQDLKPDLIVIMTDNMTGWDPVKFKNITHVLTTELSDHCPYKQHLVEFPHN